MLDHIHAAIDTRAFAIPHAEHTIVPGAGKQIGLLAAPHGGGSEVLIYPGLEMDIVFVQPGFGLPHRLVYAADRGAAITGNESGSIQAALLVALVLQHGQAHQRFDAGHIGPCSIQCVFVVQ